MFYFVVDVYILKIYEFEQSGTIFDVESEACDWAHLVTCPLAEVPGSYAITKQIRMFT